MADLSSMLDKTATDHSEHPAIRQDDLVLTYAQLRESACRVASLLTSLGVTPGDRVGIMLPNVAACASAGQDCSATAIRSCPASRRIWPLRSASRSS